MANLTKNSFTLIELLVILSIIAVLFGLTLPALKRVTEISDLTICKENYKQLGTAYTLFASDNTGYFPYERYGEAGAKWRTRLNEYLDAPAGETGIPATDGVFRCPSDDNLNQKELWGSYGHVVYKAQQGNPALFAHRLQNINDPHISWLSGHRQIVVDYYHLPTTALEYRFTGFEFRHLNKDTFLFSDMHVEELDIEEASYRYLTENTLKTKR